MKVNVAGIFSFNKFKVISIKKPTLTLRKKILKLEIMHGIFMEQTTCQLKKSEAISKKILTLKLNG